VEIGGKWGYRVPEIPRRNHTRIRHSGHERNVGVRIRGDAAISARNEKIRVMIRFRETRFSEPDEVKLLDAGSGDTKDSRINSANGRGVRKGPIAR
jgi:hypothetical protein